MQFRDNKTHSLSFVFNYDFVCISVCGYVHLSMSIFGGQGHWILLQLELRVIVNCLIWVLRIKVRSSEITASALNY